MSRQELLIPAKVTVKYMGRRGSRILKWGVNFCNNIIEPKPGWGVWVLCISMIQKEKGGGNENSPISPPLDPRLMGQNPDITGAIHSTKISGLGFENFLGSNGSRPVRTVSIYSPRKRFALFFKMADVSVFPSSKGWLRLNIIGNWSRRRVFCN